MQSLDIHQPGMPDLEFTLLVTALCTSRQTALNIPEGLRTTIFNRCWALIHDSAPPGRAEERVLDLRPWTDLTVEAMVESIRGALSDAGIQILTWDHARAESTEAITPDALPLIDRLERLYPQGSPGHLAAVGASSEPDLQRLVGQLAALMPTLSAALKRRALHLARKGLDPTLVVEFIKGAALIQESGHVYMSWVRHAALSEGLEEGDADAAA